MLTAEYLTRITEGAEEIASKLRADILKRIIERIMIRLQRGDPYILTAADKWRMQALTEAGYLLEDIQREIAKTTRLQESEIRAAMEEAGVKAIEFDDAIYRAAGLEPTDIFKTPYFTRLMQRGYEATVGEWRNLTRTTAIEAQNLFREACDRAYTLTASGGVSYTQAYVEAIDYAVNDGVMIHYPSGHVDTIETATLRCIRTGVSQTTANVQLERMKEMRHDLVITSSHLAARPSHAVWQGKIFHVDWATFSPYTYHTKDEPPPEPQTRSDKYPDLVEVTRYGYVDGLCGANCGHSFSPYFEGMEQLVDEIDPEENARAYETQQRQRALERRIRKTKRDVMAYKDAVDGTTDAAARAALEAKYMRKAATLQRQNAEYKQFCEANDLKQLRERLKIAKWTREQAAQARGAAARYNNSRGNK